MRELLALFADLSDMVSEQRIRGIESVSSRPIVRGCGRRTASTPRAASRSRVRFDEKAFEGTGVFLLGAVLDRFFAEYTSINSFTETVIEIQAARRDQALAAACRLGAGCCELPRASFRPSPGASISSRRCASSSVGAESKPRIGDSAVHRRGRRQSRAGSVRRIPGVQRVEVSRRPSGAVPKLFARFLGFFGPQGALPLNTTVEAYHWSNRRDPSFARFTDIFCNRFLQLFFRAWADAQADRPARPAGRRPLRPTMSAPLPASASDSLNGRDSLDDIAKLPFAGLVSSTVKSASRLRQLVRGIFHVDVDVEERVGCWLIFEPSDRLMLGAERRARRRHLSRRPRLQINEKICVVDQGAATCASTGSSCRPASCRTSSPTSSSSISAIASNLTCKLSLPARYAPPTQLGVSGELGWTAWIAPDNEAGDDVYFDDAHFNVLERRRARQAEHRRR